MRVNRNPTDFVKTKVQISSSIQWFFYLECLILGALSWFLHITYVWVKCSWLRGLFIDTVFSSLLLKSMTDSSRVWGLDRIQRKPSPDNVLNSIVESVSMSPRRRVCPKGTLNHYKKKACHLIFPEIIRNINHWITLIHGVTYTLRQQLIPLHIFISVHSQEKQLAPLYIFISARFELSLYHWTLFGRIHLSELWAVFIGMDWWYTDTDDIQWRELFLLRNSVCGKCKKLSLYVEVQQFFGGV